MLQMRDLKKQREAPALPRGARLVLSGLTVLYVTALRQVLYHLGVPISIRMVGQLGGLIGVILVSWGVYLFRQSGQPRILASQLYLITITLWRIWLLCCFVGGILRGNPWNVAGNEFVTLWLCADALTLGVDDRFWHAVAKPLTVMFYLGAALVTVYYTTPTIVTDVYGSSEVYDISATRYTGSLGFDMRPLIGSGLVISVWGLVQPRWTAWKVLQVGSLFVVTFIEVGLFKFRSYLIVAAMVVGGYGVIRPVVEGRLRLGRTVLLAVACGIAIAVFMRTEAYEVLWRRVSASSGATGIFDSRLAELRCFLTDMQMDVIWGRGLGGSYNAFDAFGTNASVMWPTIHFGILIFVLKGGIIMLGLFLAFLFRGSIPQPRWWYDNPCNLAAAMLWPIVLFQFALNPIALTPSWIFRLLPAMMVLARFGRKNRYA